MRQHGLALFVRPHNAAHPSPTLARCPMAFPPRPLRYPSGSCTLHSTYGQTMFNNATYILACTRSAQRLFFHPYLNDDEITTLSFCLHLAHLWVGTLMDDSRWRFAHQSHGHTVFQPPKLNCLCRNNKNHWKQNLHFLDPESSGLFFLF